MIYLEKTPNNLGVYIYGDYNDFENLYDSLHNIVGDEEQNPHYVQMVLNEFIILYAKGQSKEC